MPQQLFVLLALVADLECRLLEERGNVGHVLLIEVDVLGVQVLPRACHSLVLIQCLVMHEIHLASS